MSNQKPITHLWLGQFLKVYLDNPTYNLTGEDKQKLKDIRKEQDIIEGVGFFWVMGALVFDFQKNAKKFAKFKGFNNLCAKLPHFAFHSLNAFACSYFALAHSQKLLRKSADIVSKYDPEVIVLKYGNIYRSFIDL